MKKKHYIFSIIMILVVIIVANLSHYKKIYAIPSFGFFAGPIASILPVCTNGILITVSPGFGGANWGGLFLIPWTALGDTTVKPPANITMGACTTGMYLAVPTACVQLPPLPPIPVKGIVTLHMGTTASNLFCRDIPSS